MNLSPRIMVSLCRRSACSASKIAGRATARSPGRPGKKGGSGISGECREHVTPLYPIDIEIDNKISDRYTVLKINTPDTVGFLYEFSNALAFNHINIARMDVRSIGSGSTIRSLLLTIKGRKLPLPEKQRELRAATVLIKHFTHLLPHSPNPEAALITFSGIPGPALYTPKLAG